MNCCERMRRAASGRADTRDACRSSGHCFLRSQRRCRCRKTVLAHRAAKQATLQAALIRLSSAAANCQRRKPRANSAERARRSSECGPPAHHAGQRALLAPHTRCFTMLAREGAHDAGGLHSLLLAPSDGRLDASAGRPKEVGCHQQRSPLRISAAQGTDWATGSHRCSSTAGCARSYIAGAAAVAFHVAASHCACLRRDTDVMIAVGSSTSDGQVSAICERCLQVQHHAMPSIPRPVPLLAQQTEPAGFGKACISVSPARPPCHISFDEWVTHVSVMSSGNGYEANCSVSSGRFGGSML